MSVSRHVACIVTIASLIPAATFATDSVAIQERAYFDPKAQADEELKKCDVETMIGRDVLEQARRRRIDAVAVQGQPSGPVVRVRITDLKKLNVTEIRLLSAYAELARGDQVISSRLFVAKTARRPTQEITECDVIGLLTVQIGGRVAKWIPRALKSPSLDTTDDGD